MEPVTAARRWARPTGAAPGAVVPGRPATSLLRLVVAVAALVGIALMHGVAVGHVALPTTGAAHDHLEQAPAVAMHGHGEQALPASASAGMHVTTAGTAMSEPAGDCGHEGECGGHGGGSGGHMAAPCIPLLASSLVLLALLVVALARRDLGDLIPAARARLVRAAGTTRKWSPGPSLSSLCVLRI